MSTRDGGELKRLEQRIALLGRGGLQKKMRKNIRVAARPVIADLRSAVMAVDVSSSKGGVARPDNSTGLRTRISKALTVATTKRGIRIRVPAGKIGSHGYSLPRYLDADLNKYKRWRHPVFGRIEHEWVEQRGQPWFFTTIRRHYPTFRRAVLDAMAEAERELTR